MRHRRTAEKGFGFMAVQAPEEARQERRRAMKHEPFARTDTGSGAYNKRQTICMSLNE
jgi:hypothetical protein